MKRFALYVDDDVLSVVDRWYVQDDCKSKSDFIAKAILFYGAYLNTKDAAWFLPEVLSTMIQGYMEAMMDRIGSLLFKLIVEESMVKHLLAADTDVDMATLEKLRRRAMEDVSETNGKISFADILRYQKGLGYE